MWENKIDIHQVAEIRAKTTTYFGVGAIHKIADIAGILAQKGTRNVIVITGKSSHIKTGAWDIVKKALEDNGIAYVGYNKITPNPTVTQVDEAAALAGKSGATAVIAIGGGSPIDAAKAVAVMMEYPERTATELCEFKFTPEKAAPLVVVNLTHGTGTEVDRFAVVSIPEKQYKPALAYDCLYPTFSIDDPALMTLLPANQTRYVTVDAVNHVIEASTTIATNPFAILTAKETVRLIAKYLPVAIKDPGNLTARYYLLYASMIAGISFDNGLLHYTHALEHPLSGVKPELAHGLGLSMLLPAVVRQIYPVTAEVLSDVLSPIIPGLKGKADEADIAAEKVSEWLNELGIPSTLREEGFKEADVEKLTKLAFETPSLGLLLSLAPVKATPEVVSTIYRESM